MADFYSDHYTATAASTSVDDPRIKTAPGIAHAKIHYKRGSVTTSTATAAGDALRFFPMKSSDRLLQLMLSHTADASTSASGDVGLYATDGGAALDIDLFGDVLVSPMDDITAAIVRQDLIVDGALTNEDVGKMLWEQLAVGAGTDTTDPHLVYDVVLTIAAEVGIVATEYILEAYYTSAGS
jgi:hypothetical protein